MTNKIYLPKTIKWLQQAKLNIQFPSVTLAVPNHFNNGIQMTICLDFPPKISKFANCLNVTNGHGIENNNYWYGRIFADGELWLFPTAINDKARLLENIKNVLLQLEADRYLALLKNGQLTEKCAFSKVPLDNLINLHHGYTSVCAKLYNLNFSNIINLNSPTWCNNDNQI